MRTPIRQVTINAADIGQLAEQQYNDIGIELLVRDRYCSVGVLNKMVAALITFYDLGDEMTFNLSFDEPKYEGLYVEIPSLGLDIWEPANDMIVDALNYYIASLFEERAQ